MARRIIQITGLGKLKQNQEQDLTREEGIYHSFCRSVLVSCELQTPSQTNIASDWGHYLPGNISSLSKVLPDSINMQSWEMFC